MTYDATLNEFVALLEASRRATARAVNSIMTATYWEIGRRIVEIEQGGKGRAEYGEALLKRLAKDLTARFGRGFSRQNLQQMRLFYLAHQEICQTLSGKSHLAEIAKQLPLSWSHYVKLLAVKTADARKFYEDEALRGGWSVRQLDRQINSLFYERALLSKNKAAMLKKGASPKPEDAVSPDEEIRDPLVLEFLNLKDEYSELELEELIIKHLENFLLELGADFTFVGRQKRLRIDDEWFRVDLVFYHRRLRCLILIDLKLGKLTHADIGQMHLYTNYAKAHWMLEDENPPIGLILCSHKGEALARYALEDLPNKVVAREYLMLLPDEKTLQSEIEKAKRTFSLKK
ncbi:MAG: PDDEXK nuclease domain-containing protein [Acidobacteriota bacterium]